MTYAMTQMERDQTHGQLEFAGRAWAVAPAIEFSSRRPRRGGWAGVQRRHAEAEGAVPCTANAVAAASPIFPPPRGHADDRTNSAHRKLRIGHTYHGSPIFGILFFLHPGGDLSARAHLIPRRQWGAGTRHDRRDCIRS